MTSVASSAAPAISSAKPITNATSMELVEFRLAVGRVPAARALILQAMPKGRILAREHRGEAHRAVWAQRQDVLQRRDTAATVTLCAFCPWSHEGTAAEGREPLGRTAPPLTRNGSCPRMLDAVAGFTFRLFSPDGDEPGQFVTAVPNWSAGDRFLIGIVGGSAFSRS